MKLTQARPAKAELYVLFKVDKSRGSKVLLEVLGKEFDGILGCDYFSAYRKYMKDCGIELQFCLAHLIRDVKFLTSLPDRPTRRYAEKLLEALRTLFALIRNDAGLDLVELRRALEAQRNVVLALGTSNVPGSNHAQNLAKRFRENGDGYFRFITTPGIEPTNNDAFASYTIRGPRSGCDARNAWRKRN